MDSVSEALKTARYGEAVVVGISSEESPDEKKELVLVATLDEEQGGIVWKDITSVSTNPNIAIIRHVRTKRWLLPMLNDERRNELYDAAIEAACREAVKRHDHKEGPLHVLDIGSGTGLLAMMAAKHSLAALGGSSDGPETSDPSSTLKVTSLEMASAMARLANMTIASNQLQSCIQVIEGHSCKTVLDRKAHLCTSELLESGLLGEGLLPALRDAWKRLLHPNAVMVPQRARVYAQILEGRGCIGSYRGPNLDGKDSIRLSTSGNDNDVLLGSSAEPHIGDGIIVPLHAETLFRLSVPGTNGIEDRAHALCDPVMVLDFDFSRENIPGPEGRACTTSIVPTASGTAHGVLFWWEIDLWSDLTYSTEVGKEPWQDHWQQCLFVFPLPHEQCTKLVQGNPINLTCFHTDFRISFAIDPGSASVEPLNKRPRHSASPAMDLVTINRFISPERAYQLNDRHRFELLQKAISAALATKGVDAPILDLSDFSLCAIIAAVEGAKTVSSLESSSGGIPLLSARVAQLGNGLPRTDDAGEAHFQVLQSHAENLTLELFSGLPIQVVLAEPYYELLEGWHLQEALNYYYLVRSLKQRGVVSTTASAVPSFASVMGCAFQCDSFANAYKGCGDTTGSSKVRGFCHEVVNQLGSGNDMHAASVSLWQYDYKKMTDSLELARLSYEGTCCIENNGSWKSTPFRTTGTCHGLICWIDYGLCVECKDRSSDDSEFRILSTDSPSHRQVVRMLSSPVTLSEGHVDNALFFCKATLGGLDGCEDHAFEMNVQL